MELFPVLERKPGAVFYFDCCDCFSGDFSQIFFIGYKPKLKNPESF
jgi:hypothetical protein